MKKLSQRTPNGMLYIDSINNDRHDNSMEHLTCFAPGLIALNAYLSEDKSEYEEDIQWAKSVAYTCYQMYVRQSTRLSPESVSFRDGEMKPHIKYNLLRPETVESLYILHEVTNDPIFVKWGWDIYKAFETISKTDFGYAEINDVDMSKSQRDKLESFFPAETLKYLYLLFDTNHKIDLHNYVFNTEAHPFKIY